MVRSPTERVSILRQAHELARATLSETHEIDAPLDWKLAAVVAKSYLEALDTGEIAREDIVQFVAQQSLTRLLMLLGPPRHC